MENKLYGALLTIILVIFIAVILSYGLIEYSLNVSSIHKNTTYSTSQEWQINTNISKINDSRWNLTNYSSKLETDVGPGDIDIEKSELSINNDKTDYWIMVLVLIGVVSICIIGLIYFSISELAI